MTGYPRYTAQVHAQFQTIINSMNNDIGVTVSTSNALFTQVKNKYTVAGLLENFRLVFLSEKVSKKS